MSLSERPCLPPQFSSLPQPIQEPLELLLQKLTSQLGAEIQALALYGGILRGRYRPESDVNLLIVLGEASAPTLMKMEECLTAARREINLAPFILETGELMAVADVFPVKMLDIQRQHLLLWGKDPLPDIRVEREHIRLHIEEGLRNLQLRLRTRLAGNARDGRTLHRHLQNLVRPLALHLRELLLLVGVTDAGDDSTGILARASQHWNLPAGPLKQLAALRTETTVPASDWAALASETLQILSASVRVADTLEVKS
jgi:predicted nucleotidyltransferase